MTNNFKKNSEPHELQENINGNLGFNETQKKSLIQEDLKNVLSPKITEEQLEIYREVLEEIKSPRSWTPWWENIESLSEKIDDKKLADEIYSKAALTAAWRGTGYEGGFAGWIFDGLMWSEKFIEKINDKKLADKIYSEAISKAISVDSYSKEDLEYWSDIFACKWDKKKLNDFLESRIKNGNFDYDTQRLALKLDNRKVLNKILDYKLKKWWHLEFDETLAVELNRKDVLLEILNEHIRTYLSCGGSWADKVCRLSQILGDKRSFDEIISDYKKMKN